jgi:tetraacyldisaccharide 4'-kinase
LREPVRRLREVDAVVMNGEEPGTARFLPKKWSVPKFAMRLGHEAFAALTSNQQLAPAEFALMTRGRRVAAVAGIGNPERFFDHLARLGIAARRLAFPDHHAYRAADLKLPGVEVIVMTEKDAVKCAALADARMWSMRVDALVDPELDTFLHDRLAARSADGSKAA